MNESDTVAILNDLLADAFGYAKYFEITSQFFIRGIYCDLAIKLDNKVTVPRPATKALRTRKTEESASHGATLTETTASSRITGTD